MTTIADIDLVSIVAILCVFGVPIIAIIAGVWHKHAQHKAETALKRQMIDRGMSAEEIAMVISAKPLKTPQRSNGRPVAYCPRCGSGTQGVNGACPQCGKTAAARSV